MDASTGKRTKQLLIAVVAFLLGFPVFVILHGVFDAMAQLASGLALVSGALGVLSVICFYAASCLVAALIVRLTDGQPKWLSGILLAVVPVPACLVAVLLLLQALSLSKTERDEAAGFNGSFEVVSSGLPANWAVYHRPLRDGQAEFFVDTTEAVHGDRAVKFQLHKAFPGHGWSSPGLFQLTDADPGQTYDVSLWVKNRGSAVRLRITSEFPDEEPKTPIIDTIGIDRTGEDEWRQFSYIYTVPPPHHDIRLDLHAMEPGMVWIDDVRVVPARDR
jgi:hypothetical protein